MNKNLIKVILFIIIFLTGCGHSNVNERKSKDYYNAYNNDAKIYWENIFEKDQDTMDYIIKWSRDNSDIEDIYESTPENGVCFVNDSGEVLLDTDECITNFIKKYDISIFLENGEINFIHELWDEEEAWYALMYIEQDNNVNERYFKLKDNYYYEVCFH